MSLPDTFYRIHAIAQTEAYAARDRFDGSAFSASVLESTDARTPHLVLIAARSADRAEVAARLQPILGEANVGTSLLYWNGRAWCGHNHAPMPDGSAGGNIGESGVPTQDVTARTDMRSTERKDWDAAEAARNRKLAADFDALKRK